MIKISKSLFKVDYKRRKELIERTKVITKLIEKNRTSNSYNSGLEWKIAKAKSLYWLKYNEHLTIEETTLLYLYTTFPNDNDFLNILKRYNMNFEKISEIYGVCTSFVKLRYFNIIYMDLNKYKDLSNHKEMNEHKKMNEHKNMDEHKFLEDKNEINAHKTLNLTLTFVN